MCRAVFDGSELSEEHVIKYSVTRTAVQLYTQSSVTRVHVTRNTQV